MTSALLGVSLVVLSVAFAGTSLAQEPGSDADSEAGDGDAVPDIERCFSVPAIVNMNVLSNRHVYIRTRGNHYLVTTDRVCDNLLRSYRLNTARLVPYGNTVCQEDGSYLVYDSGSRSEELCPLLTVERVDSREHADAIAEADRSLVETEEVDPEDIE